LLFGQGQFKNEGDKQLQAEQHTTAAGDGGGDKTMERHK
jgi:hypothetical protein